jgi:ABC-type transport system substrate-binding protein
MVASIMQVMFKTGSQKGLAKFSLGVVAIAILLIVVVLSSSVVQVNAKPDPTPQQVYPGLTNFNTPVLAPNQVDYHFPYVGKEVFEWTYTTPQDIYEAMTAGQADINSFTDISILQAAESNPDFNVTSIPTFGFGQIQFNFARYPYNNTYFRQGIASLIDYSAIESTVCHGGLTCQASPQFLLNSSYPQFYSQAAMNYYQQYESYNPTRAIADFEKAGLLYNAHTGTWSLPNGTAFEPTFLYWAGNDPSTQQAQLLKSAAAKANLTINLVGESITTIIDLTIVPFPHYNEQTWDMLWLGWVFVSQIGPLQLEYLFGEQGYQYENAGGFYNKTIFDMLQQAVDTSSLSQSQSLTDQVQVDLMQQLPYIILWWNVADTVINIHDFRGYAVSPGFGISTDNVHPTGSALNGTFYIPDVSSDVPAAMDIYSAPAASEDSVLYPLYDTPMITSIANPAQLLPWIATNWTVKSGLNISTPDGPLVNGETVTMNFAHNVTFQDGVPLTAMDYNFTLWYLDEAGINSTKPYYIDGLQLNYTAETSQAGLSYGAIPELVYSQVNATNPYQITLYLNTSSVWELYKINSFILPEHIFDSTPPQNLYQKLFINELGSGAYIFDGYSKSEGLAEIVANYAYWKFNPLLLWSNVTQGNTYNVETNVTTLVWNNNTDLFNTIPITNVSSAQMQVGYLSGANAEFLNGQPAVVSMTQLSGSVYTGSLNTAELAPGLYEVTLNATYTAGGLIHHFYRFYSLTVTAAHTTSTTSTSTTTPVVSTTTSQISTTSTTTTTTSGGISTAVIAVIVVIIIVVIGGLILAFRRR